MDINIAVAACLQFLCRQEKFLIQFLIQLIEDQASLSRYKGRIRIGIFFVADIHDGLALFIDIIQHPDKILLIIPVIPIAFCHDRFHFFQCAFYNIVHNGDRDLVRIHLVHFFHYISADLLFLILRKIGQCTISGLTDSVDHLLDIELLQTVILLHYLDLPLRSVHLPIIDFLLFCHPCFSPS